MTNPQGYQSAPYPGVPTVGVPHPGVPAPGAVPQGRGGRAFLAAALVFVGGYLVIAALNGFLVNVVAGLGQSSPAIAALVVGQFVFALLVVVAGLFATPGALGGRVAGAALVVVVVVIVLLLVASRINGLLRVPPLAAQMTFANVWLMTVLVIGIAWLIVRRARLGWLALLGVVVLAPVPYLLTFAGVESAIVQILMFVLSALVGAGILAAGRPWDD